MSYYNDHDFINESNDEARLDSLHSYRTEVEEFRCDACERYQPADKLVGDDEPICLDCHTAKLDEYRDAFDEMLGNPLEALDRLTAQQGRMEASGQF